MGLDHHHHHLPLPPSEHPSSSPSPFEPRGIYGFILALLMSSLTFFYFLWMLSPTTWLETLPYQPPQTYWGFCIPVIFCTTLFLFAFCIYPSLHSLQDGDLDDPSAFTDPHSLPADYFEIKRIQAKEITKSQDQSAYSILSPTRQPDKMFNILNKDDDFGFGPGKSRNSRTCTWGPKRNSKNSKAKKGKAKGKEEKIKKPSVVKTIVKLKAEVRIDPVPSVSDMDLDDVSQRLYLY